MIVRMWHGRVPAEKAAAYRAFLNARAIPDDRSVAGMEAPPAFLQAVGLRND